MNWLQSFIMLLGRICLAAFFFYGIYDTIVQWEASLGMYQQQGVGHPRLVLVAITVIQLLGALSLLLGWKIRTGAFLLLVVVGVKTYILYDFWNMMGKDTADFHRYLTTFSIYTGLFGGLLYVLSAGAGKCSWDQCYCSNKEFQHDEQGD